MKLIKRIYILLIYVFIFTFSIFVKEVKAESIFTKEEQDYINKRGVIKAVSIDDTAPIQYYDKNGEVKGISRYVLDIISELTGLTFEFELYNSVDIALNSDADIIFGVVDTKRNPSDFIPLSIPYFQTESILYMNDSINPNEINNKKYAAIEGVRLPEGLDEKNIIYYDTREACLEAVNKGEADYGYANAHSVSFYILQNNYKNIITVPGQKEFRSYCVGFLNKDDILLSIINKSISTIDKNQMDRIILNASTQIERKITISMILEAYGIQIFVVFILIMGILVMRMIHNARIKNEMKIQYERYQMLSKISNEYLYEYNVKKENLELSKSCVNLFGDINNLRKLKAEFKDILNTNENTIKIIELPTAYGEKRFFKSINSFLYDDKGKIHSLIGKLVDVNEEEKEKKILIKRSETDGLTGIYNATTTKNLITERINNSSINNKDAFLLIDCDKYKNINDTYGHLKGDKVLINISNAFTKIFNEMSIIGRIGGDEFCVYIKDYPSIDYIVSKCNQLRDLIRELNRDFDVTLSIGIALLGDEKSYDDLFAKADKALYDSKKKGGNQAQFFDESTDTY